MPGLSSNGLVRSHDSGLTWGDASVIHRAQPGSGLWYNENQIVPLPDGRWLCMMRLNNGNFHRKGPLTMCRSYSRDQGYTWSYPVRTRFHGGEPGMGFLPDGAVCCMQRGGISMSQTTTEDDIIVHGFDKEGSKYLYEVSYDGGMTWPYWGDLYLTEPGSTEHVGSAIIRPLDAESAIAVYHRGIKALCEKYPPDRPQLIGASWLRKVPDDDPTAGSLRYSED